MAKSPFLEIVELSKTFRSGRGLHRVNVSLPAGAIVSLGGPNGSGKSTLLRCLAGLATYTGEARLCGRLLDRTPDIRALVGYMPQVVGFPAEATVGEVLELFSILRRDTSDTVLPSEFLPPAGERIGALSEGQRHRVGLQVALLGTPRLLLLDEPIASLDSDGRRTVGSVLRGLCDRVGVTAIVTSPSSSELDAVADISLTMNGGSLVDRLDLGESADVIRLREARR